MVMERIHNHLMVHFKVNLNSHDSSSSAIVELAKAPQSLLVP